MSITVAISTVADGTMYNRRNALDPVAIQNRDSFLQHHTMSIEAATRPKVDYSRTNYCEYKVVDATTYGRGMKNEDGIVADALITTTPGHTLFLPVADCVGVAIYDPTNEVLMVAHLGRHSLEQHGGTTAIQHLVTLYGSTPSELLVWLTPAPSKEAYPIWKLDNKGMKEATFEQLTTAGIALSNIIDNPADTTKDPNYFSYSEFLKGNKAEDGDHAIAAMISL